MIKFRTLVVVSLISVFGFVGCEKAVEEEKEPGAPGSVTEPSITPVFTNGQAADVVVGQANFSAGGSDYNTATGFDRPGGVYISSDGVLYVSDQNNGRVVGFNTIPTANGAAGDFAIGQPSLFQSGFGSGAAEMHTPASVSVHAGKLYVPDSSNHRVMRYNTTNVDGPTAVVAYGQTSTSGNSQSTSASELRGPSGVSVGGGKMAIADTNNNRVLLYNTIPTTTPSSADVMIGQTVFGQAGFVSASANLYRPASVWTDGTKIAVADNMNHRVLIWNTWPTTSGLAPDVILGQPNISTAVNTNGGVSASSMGSVYSVSSNGTMLVASDVANKRVLIWNTWPTTTQQAADVVLGQPDFTSNTAGAGATGFDGSQSISVSADGSTIAVSDVGMNRVLIFRKK